ncbi:hypothetical protein BCR34DRAFT_40834 [Clohesyomyces aquaticus]|uniref:Uncharacterized protein n=1 Tax=Clohesyomyces aquaticus TaxID=1231657 RepID=A0A1Y2A669_9PLEO|nr:hypothetical protein BCR34DRAFT_40834 [Clohesyomyces aquaticus]
MKARNLQTHDRALGVERANCGPGAGKFDNDEIAGALLENLCRLAASGQAHPPRARHLPSISAGYNNRRRHGRLACCTGPWGLAPLLAVQGREPKLRMGDCASLKGPNPPLFLLPSPKRLLRSHPSFTTVIHYIYFARPLSGSAATTLLAPYIQSLHQPTVRNKQPNKQHSLPVTACRILRHETVNPTLSQS